MRLMLLTAMFVASMVCLFAIPFVEKNLLNNQVAYYRIEVNGTEVGAANSRADAAKALADARGRLSRIYPDVVYMEREKKRAATKSIETVSKWKPAQTKAAVSKKTTKK